MQHVLAVPSPAGMDWSSALAPAELLPRLGMAGLGQAWNKTAAPRGLPPVFPKWLKWLGRVVWSLQCPFQGAGRGAVFSLSSSLVSVAHPSQFLAGFRCTYVSHLMPEHLLFSVLYNSTFPSGFTPVAKFRNISLASAAGHRGLHIQKCIHGAFPFA